MSDEERFKFGLPEDQIFLGNVDDLDAPAMFRNGQWILDSTSPSDCDNTEIQSGRDAEQVPVLGHWDDNGASFPGLFRDGRRDPSAGLAQQPELSDESSSEPSQ